jgi:hypothetical protein
MALAQRLLAGRPDIPLALLNAVCLARSWVAQASEHGCPRSDRSCPFIFVRALSPATIMGEIDEPVNIMNHLAMEPRFIYRNNR